MNSTTRGRSNGPHETERGASMVEYTMIVALIAVLALAALANVGRSVDDTFTEAGGLLDQPNGTIVLGGDSQASTDTDAAATGGDEEAADDEAATPASDDTGSDDTGSQDTGADDTSADDTGAGGTGSGNTGSGDTGAGAGSGGGSGGGSTAGGAAGQDTGGTSGGSSGGSAGSGEDEQAADQTATTGVFGEFAITFGVVDGKIVILSVSGAGWSYDTDLDIGHQMHLTFDEDRGRGEYKVKAWLTGNGELKTSVTEVKSGRN